MSAITAADRFAMHRACDALLQGYLLAQERPAAANIAHLKNQP